MLSFGRLDQWRLFRALAAEHVPKPRSGIGFPASPSRGSVSPGSGTEWRRRPRVRGGWHPEAAFGGVGVRG